MDSLRWLLYLQCFVHACLLGLKHLICIQAFHGHLSLLELEKAFDGYSSLSWLFKHLIARAFDGYSSLPWLLKHFIYIFYMPLPVVRFLCHCLWSERFEHNTTYWTNAFVQQVLKLFLPHPYNINKGLNHY